MENEKQTKDKLTKTGRGLAKFAAYSVTSVLAYIGLVALVAPLKDKNDREAETITSIAPESLTHREREALRVCQTRSARPDFIGGANAVNLTGEYGIPLASGYGLDDNCKSFALNYGDKWHAMLGRHEMQMSHNYYAANFQGYINQVRNELWLKFGDNPPDFNNPHHRFLVLDIVNKTVNRDFDYKSDERLFNQGDHTATVVEALQKGNGSWRLSGDCDDYTATKFLVLRELGFPADQMFATIVGPKDSNAINHMVLMANMQTDHRLRPHYLTLDNNLGEGSVMRASNETNYRSYIALNGQFSYVFPQALHDNQGIDLRRTAQEIVSEEIKIKTKLGWES